MQIHDIANPATSSCDQQTKAPDYKKFFYPIGENEVSFISKASNPRNSAYSDKIKSENLEMFLSGFQTIDCLCCGEGFNIKCYFRNNSCFCERCGYPHFYDVDYFNSTFRLSNVSIYSSEIHPIGDVPLPNFVKFCPESRNKRLEDTFYTGRQKSVCHSCFSDTSLSFEYSKNYSSCGKCQSSYTYSIRFKDRGHGHDLYRKIIVCEAQRIFPIKQ